MKTLFLRFVFLFHFAMLALVSLNALAAWAMGWELQVILPFKVLLVLSGIGLALKEKVRKIKWYFRVYVGYYFLLFITPLFLFFDGIFGALATSLTLYPVYPEAIEVEHKSIALIETFSGFLSAGPRYKIVRRSLFLERYYGQMQTLDEGSITFLAQGDSILLYTKHGLESQISSSPKEKDYRLNDSTFVFFAD
jgi:hypothetical protein